MTEAVKDTASLHYVLKREPYLSLKNLLKPKATSFSTASITKTSVKT